MCVPDAFVTELFDLRRHPIQMEGSDRPHAPIVLPLRRTSYQLCSCSVGGARENILEHGDPVAAGRLAPPPREIWLLSNDANCCSQRDEVLDPSIGRHLIVP